MFSHKEMFSTIMRASDMHIRSVPEFVFLPSLSHVNLHTMFASSQYKPWLRA